MLGYSPINIKSYQITVYKCDKVYIVSRRIAIFTCIVRAKCIIKNNFVVLRIDKHEKASLTTTKSIFSVKCKKGRDESVCAYIRGNRVYKISSVHGQ